jgi:hypothetical protein
LEPVDVDGPGLPAADADSPGLVPAVSRAVHPPPAELPGVIVYVPGLPGPVVGGGPVATRSSTAAAAPLSRVATPWFALAVDGEDDLVVAVDGTSDPPGVVVEVEWARRDLGSLRVIPGRSAVLGGERTPIYEQPSWRVLRLGVDARPSGAQLVRVVARDGPGRHLAVTQPVAVPHQPLASVIRGATVLVSPPQLPLLGCTRPPAIRHGIADMPDVVVGFELRDTVNQIPEVGSLTGPWYLAEDAYPVRRLWAWLTDDDAVTVVVRDQRPALGTQLTATIRRT